MFSERAKSAHSASKFCVFCDMPEDTCVVCGNTRTKDQSVSFHHFPRDTTRRKEWIKALALNKDDLKDYDRVCSSHSSNAYPHNKPELCIGKRFASPRRPWTSRAKRARAREAIRTLTPQLSDLRSPSATS